MDIYDYVPITSVEEGDQIVFQNDPIEVTSVIDSGEAIMVKGYSHLTGDNAVYIISSDAEVALWTA